MAEIHLQNLAHSYSPTPTGPEDYAIREMNHVWEQGGAYALLGPSGCGKSTLLNIISGLLSPSEGHVLFDHKVVNELTPEKRNIAQVFQFPVVYDTMTVFDNLAFPLRNQGMAEAKIHSKVQEIAEVLDLQSLLSKKARNLTADEKQKVSMGRGLVRDDVSAILFDEPLTVIDPHLKWKLRRKLKQIHEQFNITMVYVTHDQLEASTFADKIPLMTVVNYSVQDIISPERRVFVGTEWFAAVMRDEELHSALWRQIIFSFSVLAVEMPLGICWRCPCRRRAGSPRAGAGDRLAVAADPLERGGHHLADLWPRRHRPDGRMLRLGIDYSYTGNATHAWLTVLLMDVWHWTPLVALLALPACAPSRRLLPGRQHRRRSKLAVFRYIQLPKMRGVLMIAVLLRFMDSFMIYTEPFVSPAAGRAMRPPSCPVDLTQEGGGPVRPGAGGGVLADLFPDHPAAVLHFLQLDAARRHPDQGGWP
jgi:ABC-type nitrate/sulfonate/bicarbonate transport system ATPase subunit